MKKTITVSALALTLAGGSLSAQLNLPASQLLDPNAFFNQLNSAMFAAQSGLYISHAPGQDPTLPSLAPTFDSFSFTFQLDITFDPDTGVPISSISDGLFHQNANVSINDRETLFFQHIPVNPERFIAFGEFNIGYFGDDAGIRNRIRVIDHATGGEQLLFDYSILSTPGPTPPGLDGKSAFAYQFDPVPNVETQFEIYNSHTGGGIPAPGVQSPQVQGNPFNWRIYKMTSSTISDEGSGFVPGELGDVMSRDGGVYVMLLDDRFPLLQDWDDGFFLLSGFVAEVPEPSVIGLAAVLGLGGLIWFRRRKNSKVS